MRKAKAILDSLGLHRANVGDFLSTIAAFEPGSRSALQADAKPRCYPGYPAWPLPLPAKEGWPALDRALAGRRTPLSLDPAMPPPESLGSLLGLAHGITGEGGRGPTPSAGSLQALELFVVVLGNGWLPHGVYHFDRPGHHLSQLAPGASRDSWLELVPSLHGAASAPLLLILVGDCLRVESKYGDRAARFLLLEAGHLMQSLCLVAAACGLGVIPFGGCLESLTARELKLAPGDAVLYAAACGVNSC